MSRISIKCGHCKGSHKSVRAVYECAHDFCHGCGKFVFKGAECSTCRAGTDRHPARNRAWAVANRVCSDCQAAQGEECHVDCSSYWV